MASARATSTTRRSTARGGPATDGTPEISRIRWAGVALVIASLSAAMTMAAISPSSPSRPAAVGSVPSPAAPGTPAGPSDGRVPTERPEIVEPADGSITKEWEIAVAVAVPEDEVPRRQLSLVVQAEGGEPVELERPRAGKVSVDGVRLMEGANQVTAVLTGPGGPGPVSEPITVMLDRTPPTLGVAEPRDNTKTLATSITLKGTSEAGASVEVRNTAKGWVDTALVGRAGSFDKLVPLAKGRNRIIVKATDEAGNVTKEVRVVQQQDGRLVIDLRTPKKIPAAKLPRSVRIRADVTDASGKAVTGAEVVFSLVIPGQTTDENTITTDDAGRADWKVTIPKGSRREDLIYVSVKVTSPNGQSRKGSAKITVS